MSIVQSALERMKNRGQDRPQPLQESADARATSPRVAIRSLVWPQTQYATVDLSVSRLQQGGLYPGEDNILKQQEDYRAIRHEVVTAMRTARAAGDTVGPVVVITSAMPGDGKSYSAMNLALSLASEGTRDVLLVDGDTTRASLTHALGVQGQPGLLELLGSGRQNFLDYTAATTREHLRFLPAGVRTSDSADLFSSDRIGALVDAMKTTLQGHAVVFDTPPILASSETQSLVEAAGQVLLIVRANVTLQDSAREAASRIPESVPVGIVLNAWEPNSPSERKAYQLYGEYGKQPSK